MWDKAVHKVEDSSPFKTKIDELTPEQREALQNAANALTAGKTVVVVDGSDIAPLTWLTNWFVQTGRSLFEPEGVDVGTFTLEYIVTKDQGVGIRHVEIIVPEE
jgi:hypothetical protein